MEKSTLDLLKEYRAIVSESFEEDPKSHHAAWSEGYRNAHADFRLGRRSEAGYNSSGIPGSYSEEYGKGYRSGWTEIVGRTENENWGKNHKGRDIMTSKSSLELLKEYRNLVEGRQDVNVKGMPRFTMVDRGDLDSFMTKRGFEKVVDPRETESVTYKSEGLNLLVMLDHEDDFWTIEDVRQDEVLDDGKGERELKFSINGMLRDVKNLRKEKSKTVKFNTCSECDGEGCPECEYTGKYAIGTNSDHYL